MNLDATIEELIGVGKVELKFVPDQRVYVLFGVNGVGKTKVLEAMLQYRALAWAPHGWGFVRSTGTMPLWSSFHGELGTAREPSNAGDYHVWSAPLPEVSRCAPVVFLSASGRLIDPTYPMQPATSIGGFRDRTLSALHEIAAVLRLSANATGLIGRTPLWPTPEQWFVHRAQATNQYQSNQEDRTEDIPAVMSALEKIDPRINPAGLNIHVDNRVSIEVAGERRYLSELSSGFLSLVRLIQGIVSRLANVSTQTDIRNTEAVVLIDEIESHLHVQWQATIINKLKELFPNCTFVIATHSPLVLSQLSEGEAYVLERDPADGAVRTRMIESPRSRLLVDLIDEAMTIDLNELKVKNASAESQTKGKAILKSLLADGASS